MILWFNKPENAIVSQYTDYILETADTLDKKHYYFYHKYCKEQCFEMLEFYLHCFFFFFAFSQSYVLIELIDKNCKMYN